MDFFHIFLSIVYFWFSFEESILADTRIVGGSKIDITKVPFMLSLRLNGAHICGAVIISPNWGLTAAHCVPMWGKKNEYYSVRTGSSFVDKGGRMKNVTNIISHELYNDVNGDYDIALLKVKRPFKYSKRTQPINLPGNDYVNDEWAIITGWGYYKKPGNVLSEYLRYVIVPKMNRGECANDYSGRYEITPRQVCYGFQQGGYDACQGDSGGPLFTNSGIIIGITSWGEDCGYPKSPGIYTSIFLMLDWIYEKSGVKSKL